MLNLNYSRRDLLWRVCYLYYYESLSQNEIAARIGKSVMTVSRLLKEARESGLMEIKLHLPYPIIGELSSRLVEHFPGLDKAIVFDAEFLDETNIKMALGKAAASYLFSLIPPESKIGVGAGETLAYLAESVDPELADWCKGAELVQLSAMIRVDDFWGNAASVTYLLSRKLHTKAYYCPLPHFIFSDNMSENGNSIVIRVLELLRSHWKALDVAIVGIGEVQSTVTALKAGYISGKDLDRLREKGAVGDIIMHFFNIEGEIVDRSFDSKLAGISWNELKEIPQVIAVAGGEEKVEAIYGALMSGVVNVLLTDSNTADKLLSFIARR